MAMKENNFVSIYSIYQIVIAPHQHSVALMDSIKFEYSLGESDQPKNDGIPKISIRKTKNPIIIITEN